MSSDLPATCARESMMRAAGIETFGGERADGARLAALVTALADGTLSLHLGASHPPAAALRTTSTGRAAGATVLKPS